MYKKAEQIVKLLKSRKITLSVAESCTGGMLAQTITSVNGASKVFKFGIIVYSNYSKIKYLKVPLKIIKKYGSVSKECCSYLVNNLSKITKNKLSISITGIAGPKGGSKVKPVGLVYIGIKKQKKTVIKKFLFKSKKRDKIRRDAVKKSLELIENFI